MGFSKRLARDVASGVRARGRQYFVSGAVHIVHGDERSVRATVEGTERYRVSLARKKKALQVCCSCPYYQDRVEPCKHVWATILAAEQKGHLRGPNEHGPQFIDEATDDRVWEWVGRAPERNGQPGGGTPRGDRNDNGHHRRGRHERHERSRSFRGRGGSPGERRGRADARPETRPPGPPRPEWTQTVAGLQGTAELVPAVTRVEDWPPGREIVYLVDIAGTRAGRGIILEVAQRQRKMDGGWSKPRSQRIAAALIPRLPDPADREILSLLTGAREESVYGVGFGSWFDDTLPMRYQLPGPVQDLLLSRMCVTGRCQTRLSPEEPQTRPLRWDDAGPWEFWLRVTRDETGKNYAVVGELRRGEQRRPLADAVLLVPGGVVFWGEEAAHLEDFGAFEWITLLRQQGTMTVPVQEKDKLLGELLRLPRLPRLELPRELHFEEVSLPPRPRLRLDAPHQAEIYGGTPRLRGELSFDYDGEVVPAGHPGRGVYQAGRRRLLLRDPAAEAAAAEQLPPLGFRRPAYGPDGLELSPRNLPRVVKTLLEAGWDVEAEGKVYRRPGAFEMEVTSGIDWFELRGGVDFGGHLATLPELLATLRRGENMVRLDDGTYGLLPEEWLKKYGALAGLGTAEGDHLRFGRTQVGVLDALLSAQPEVRCDATFARVRQELHAFAGVEPADPPGGFTGRLRGYQREGLGWLHFLQNFGFGGCLADDMGLGKTVQVLALLESRRELRAGDGAGRPAPSLVVVPKSLVFNWKQEAARFTPQLRVCDHTGAGRFLPGEHFNDYDLVLTTYGTLRRDARHFKDFRFDYCILDEAQAIKNANSESAKAARLLRADHRLALSGTPVENHLGELWSLFEFLNPGMLGSASVFQAAGGRNPDEHTRTLLARALRPFILRRTKEQVAKDLPAKLEETIHCEMEPAQRKLYDELRAHYRDSLLSRVEREGISRSRMHILEALLRLRQAACHPGLIDKKREGEPSAKLDALLAQVDEVLDEGHKVLVFSQFTKLLAIVRDRLDRDKIPYEYLDGRTRDRQAKVEHFQTDPDCKLFLISLKAGGLGLNLTAAEYVFLLDPWWNPAVEAQAMDRAHRIGQTRPVFAYRLIARDTVEEKILELQKSKRALADAIVNADNSLLRNLGREDLELLLS
jgi:superfamily II DNA or RNA helicase